MQWTYNNGNKQNGIKKKMSIVSLDLQFNAKNVSWRLVMYEMFCSCFVLERMKHRFNASSLMSERGQKEVEALYALLTFLMEV